LFAHGAVFGPVPCSGARRWGKAERSERRDSRRGSRRQQVILKFLDIFTTAGRHGTPDCGRQVAALHYLPAGLRNAILNTAAYFINFFIIS